MNHPYAAPSANLDQQETEEFYDPKVFALNGRIGRADFQNAVDAVDRLLKTHKKIDVVEVVKDIGWIEPEPEPEPEAEGAEGDDATAAAAEETPVEG